MLDEADGFDLKIEKSSDPITLARGRLEGAPFPKLVVGSTPRVKGLSHLEYREDNADALMRYHIVCPHCEADHPLLWGGKNIAHGFKGGGMGGDMGPVRHVCPHCHGAISQADYLRLWDEGAAWVSDCGAWRYGADAQWRDAGGQAVAPPRHVAFHIWTAYSPQRSWADIVREFIEASAKAQTGDIRSKNRDPTTMSKVRFTNRREKLTRKPSSKARVPWPIWSMSTVPTSRSQNFA